ncbi:dynactin subunit 4 [Cylas formicarius]|uniref:dynactin subunit 4 n=1 Tax=Cylas formicarius TaxID=197179 RepID=UPI00295876D4|nr:dynactin subunit 4 [Cylas formicarius]
MSYITGPEYVLYACTCGLLKPITRLYLCRYCSELRCHFCLCHEVDTIFCGKCSENIPSAEARIKKNRCANCFICPSCHQDLSTRSAAKGPVNPDDAKSPIKKTHYLCCYFCRWSSRDVGIPDQPSATGGWPVRENVHANHLQELLDTYKQMMSAGKQQKENDKRKHRTKFVSYTDRTGVTASALRKRLGLPDVPHTMLKQPKPPESAVAKTEVEDLPDNIFTKPVNLLEVTTIEQRLLQPESQPETIDKLFPIHKQLSIKQSLRCRRCDHNVSKPEFNPNSVKFRIQLFAFYHIPEIRIVTIEPLRAGITSELILKFTNPTQYQIRIKILDLDLGGQALLCEQAAEEVAESLEQTLSMEEKQPTSLHSLPLSSSQPSSLLSLSSKQPSITIKPRKIIQKVNCDIAMPESSFILLPRDDAAEYDDCGDPHNIEDDIKLVKFRKSNKAFIKLAATPKVDAALNDEVVCGFTISAVAVDSESSHKYDHKVRVFVRLGNIVGSG